MTALFLLTVAFWAAGVVIHWLFTRLVSNRDFVKNGYKFYLVLCLALGAYALHTGFLNTLFMCLEFTILWNLYTVFFINLMNSVSLRMMVEINQAPGQMLSHGELESLYSDNNALGSRLRGLVGTGFMTMQGTELKLTPKGRRLAAMLKTIRCIYGIEFYG